MGCDEDSICDTIKADVVEVVESNVTVADILEAQSTQTVNDKENSDLDVIVKNTHYMIHAEDLTESSSLQFGCDQDSSTDVAGSVMAEVSLPIECGAAMPDPENKIA